MEANIKIADKLVALKTTGATLLRYKMQFGKDLLTELIKLEDAYKKGEFRIGEIDFEFFFNILWIMAKTANPEIKSLVEWLDDFDDFPILEILPNVIEMLSNLIGIAKKKLQK